MKKNTIFQVSEFHMTEKKIELFKEMSEFLSFPVTNTTEYGVHGYDNEDPNMHAIFMAKGPLFAKGKTLKSVNMIDLYNLFCYILKIECNTTDGSKKLDMYDELFASRPVRHTQQGKRRHSRIRN